jgi:nitrogen fixation/metabolism regulation signal transduction histidine kinase
LLGHDVLHELAAERHDSSLFLRVRGDPKAVLLRAGTLERHGRPVRVTTFTRFHSMLDAVDVAAQTDLVRVLTHKILNSLTPVTSIAEKAARMLHSDSRDLPEVRMAIGALARRAAGLH